MKHLFNAVKLLILLLLSANVLAKDNDIIVAAERTGHYLPLLNGQKVGLVANQTSRVADTHLLDTLVASGINVMRVFAPEHGFRGDHSAGAYVKDDKDVRTGVPVISLYGSNRKPTNAQVKDLDWLIFDIQDVGARFYTYISTLHYVMEAAAENGVKVLVLDRPNPNGHFVDGPVLKPEFSSFVGMHPVPVVHGMTIGEYARMINGEGWLKNGLTCDLTVIEIANYARDMEYRLPVPPSPNLPTMESIYLYPSLCFFEGTVVSVGRGTDYPFEIIGLPGFEKGEMSFTPVSVPGVADNPPHKGKECHGFQLTRFAKTFIRPSGELYLLWLTGFYEQHPDKENFFNNFFDKLAGTDQLRKQIIAGKSIEEIRYSWQDDLDDFKEMREQYLIYN